jgi:predicted ribosome quality control (RQC) complex YloA/Tae2 family protein
VTAIQQPRWERVLEIGFARGTSGSVAAPAAWLVVELMGKLSNVILRDEGGVISGALHLVAAEVNRYRTIAPHVQYRSPPPQTRPLHGQLAPRLEGAEASESALRESAAEALDAHVTPVARHSGKAARREEPTVASLLATHVLGFSRELGREVAARALDAPDAPLALELDWGKVARALREVAGLPDTHFWRPMLVYADAVTAPIAFAVYEPHQYAGATLRAMSSANALLAAYYRGAEWHAEMDGARSELRHLLRTQRDRCLRKDVTLRDELAALGEASRLREEADVLLAFQTEVPPRAQAVTLENPFAEPDAEGHPSTMTLALDPRLSAVENANRRYARYHKLQRAAAAIPPQIEANTLELARVEQLYTDLTLTETPAEIALVRAEVVEAGYLRDKATRNRSAKTGKSQKAKPGKGGKSVQPARRVSVGGVPLKRQSSDGMMLLLGRNSHQNEEVTFHQAGASDLWLHARGVPGAHVVVKSGGRPVSETTLREAASLAAYYSQARDAGSVPVDYTEQRYVRHMKGGGPGMVIYEHERTLHVLPFDPGVAQ